MVFIRLGWPWNSKRGILQRGSLSLVFGKGGRGAECMIFLVGGRRIWSGLVPGLRLSQRPAFTLAILGVFGRSVGINGWMAQAGNGDESVGRGLADWTTAFFFRLDWTQLWADEAHGLPQFESCILMRSAFFRGGSVDAT